MRKKRLFNTNAQISYTIEPVTKTRALSLERFLKKNLSGKRDTYGEDFFISKTSNAKDKQYNIVSYCFRTREEALADAESVNAILDELHKQWLRDEDAAFYAIFEVDRDARTDRLAHKALNGIVDDEVIDADARVFRNIELVLGKTAANLAKKADRHFFGERE